jgi:pyruvate/2-oxoglutarate/acetoin dehydrogenase E1 component
MSDAVAVRDRNVSVIIAETLAQEMELEPRIVLLGEDIGVCGGTFGATRGLLDRFGADRVRDTPISEMAFHGMAVGLAMEGYRPLVELMFVDFLGVCLEQIYNAAAKIHYMSGGRVRMPVVVKTAGGCIGSAAQHSQSLWGLFGHLPGLHVAVPSCPYDFKGMLAWALRSDDPVIFIEHRDLLLRKRSTFDHGADVPVEPYVARPGAAVVRAGTDLTVATLGASVGHCIAAADALHGYDVEVIDLRTVVPLDAAAVAASVARTSRLLVVDEDYLSCGLSGEVVARVVEALGPAAVRAVGRHAVPDVPIPAAASLESAVVPNTASIAAAMQEVLER